MEARLGEHYEERNDSELPAGLGRPLMNMVHRLDLHRAYLPDVVFTNTTRAYAAQKFNALLTALDGVRAAHPKRFFYVYVEGSGRGPEQDQIYLMASSDGRNFEASTEEMGVRAFCRECAMLTKLHDRFPADDPDAQEIARSLGFAQLGETGPAPPDEPSL
jgi:hypothetical protein